MICKAMSPLLVVFDMRERWAPASKICGMSVNLLKSQQLVQFLIYILVSFTPCAPVQKQKERIIVKAVIIFIKNIT